MKARAPSRPRDRPAAAPTRPTPASGSGPPSSPVVEIFEGANVENASFGLTLCAERAAVTAAVLAGRRDLQAVAVASGTVPPTPPCGMCLQTLAEFAGPELPVTLAGARGSRVETTLGELLPRAFGAAQLGKGGR